MDLMPARHTLSSASLPSITEFSEPLSEADEIESVLHLQRLGDDAFKRKNFHQAISFFTDALEIDEENAQLLSRRAVANFHLHNYKQAQRDAELIVKYNPHVAKGHQLLAMCLQRLNKLKPAVSSYLRAICLDAGNASKLIGRLRGLVAVLCNRESLPPDSSASLPSQLLVIGKALADAGHFNACCEVLQAVISLERLDLKLKLEALFLLGSSHKRSREYERSLDCSWQCLLLALSSKQSIYVLKCYLQMVQISFLMRNFEMGIVHAQNVIALCKDGSLDSAIGDPSLDVSGIGQEMEEGLTLAYIALGNMDTAYHHAERYVANIKKENQNLEIISKAHWLLGTLQEANSQFPEALDSYKNFLEVSRQKQDQGSVARAYGCLGRVYHNLGKLTLAKTYYEQQMHISEQLKYYTMLAPVLKNLADLHQDLGDDEEEIIKYLGRYLRVSRKLDEYQTECRAFMSYGEFYHRRKEYFLARHYFEEAVNLGERSEEIRMKMIAGLKLARTLVDSAEMPKSITDALPLITAAQAYFEEASMARQKEGGVVSEEVKGYIEESYLLQQMSLYTLELPLHALDVLEARRMRQLQSLLNEDSFRCPGSHLTPSKIVSAKKGMEALKRHVKSTGRPVLYLSPVKGGVFGWLVTPDSDDIHHYFQQVTEECHIDLIQSTLAELQSSEMAEYNVECRTLPITDSEMHKETGKRERKAAKIAARECLLRDNDILIAFGKGPIDQMECGEGLNAPRMECQGTLFCESGKDRPESISHGVGKIQDSCSTGNPRSDGDVGIILSKDCRTAAGDCGSLLQHDSEIGKRPDIEQLAVNRSSKYQNSVVSSPEKNHSSGDASFKCSKDSGCSLDDDRLLPVVVSNGCQDAKERDEEERQVSVAGMDQRKPDSIRAETDTQLKKEELGHSERILTTEGEGTTQDKSYQHEDESGSVQSDENTVSNGGSHKPGPLQVLHSLLLEPFMSFLRDSSTLAVVVDDVLLRVPFDCLMPTCHNIAPIRINLIPSLHFLLDSVKYPLEEMKTMEKFQEDDPRSPGTLPVYLDELHRVNIRPGDRPHQPIKTNKKEPPIMATNCQIPSLVAFNLSSHNEVAVGRDVMKEMEERTLVNGRAPGSTLITNDWSGREIPSSHEGAIQEHKPVQSTAGIFLVGNPKLPEELQWQYKVWRPAVDLVAAQSELHQLANLLNAAPHTGAAATKENILERLPSAKIVHIATYGSWTKGVFVCSPDPVASRNHKGPLQMDHCLIKSSDILQLKLTADLVVLNLGYGNHHRDLSMKLPLAFLEAGAKSVLLPQWAVCSSAQSLFWKCFYNSLHSGMYVTEALGKAKDHVRSDARFKHPRHWAGYCLFGGDPLIDLSKLKSAFLDHRLNEVERTVLANLPSDVLNISGSEDPSMRELTMQLAACLSGLLIQHQNNEDVLPSVVDLVTEHCHISSGTDKRVPPLTTLLPSVASSAPALRLLLVLGFHFQPSGDDPSSPPTVLYPQWDPDGLGQPTLQALHALMLICDFTACSLALSKVLKQTQPLLSSLVDVLAITKHIPEVQLRVSDPGVARVWRQAITRELLLTVGFDAAGTLLMYKRSLGNMKLLSAVLEVLCALTGEKGQAMLSKVDPRFLGPATRHVISRAQSHTPIRVSRMRRSSVLRSPEPAPPPPKQLPSLNPVMVTKNKLTFSTPWKSLPEDFKEKQEKLTVVQSLDSTTKKAKSNAKMTQEWHRQSANLQASLEMAQLGRMETKPGKVKVHPGGLLSSIRIPLGYKPPPTMAAIEQRRDYAYYILRERQADVARRHQKAVHEVFLPYVKN